MNVVGLRSGLASFIKTFPGVVPAADIHHGHAALVMLVRSAGVLFSNGFHTLFCDFDVHTRTVRELLAGALEDLFELLLSAGKLLLVKEGKGFVVELELSLDAGINHFYPATLRRMGRR